MFLLKVLIVTVFEPTETGYRTSWTDVPPPLTKTITSALPAVVESKVISTEVESGVEGLKV